MDGCKGDEFFDLPFLAPVPTGNIPAHPFFAGEHQVFLYFIDSCKRDARLLLFSCLKSVLSDELRLWMVKEGTLTINNPGVPCFSGLDVFGDPLNQRRGIYDEEQHPA